MSDVNGGVISQVVSIALLLLFLWSGYQAHWFDAMLVWPPNNFAILFLGLLVAWIGRNEFGKS